MALIKIAMKSKLILLLVSVMVLCGCQKEKECPEYYYAGDLIVNSVRLKVNGTPVDEFRIGLFDLMFYNEGTNRLRPEDAVQVKQFSNQTLTFTDINAGTYFVGVIGNDEASRLFRKVVQVVTGQTSTVTMYD